MNSEWIINIYTTCISLTYPHLNNFIKGSLHSDWWYILFAHAHTSNNVSNIVSRQYKKNKIVVVLSAMAGVTDQLQSYIDEINYPPSKETDLIMTSGEQVTVGLLSMILNKKGIKSVPLLGWQVPIITDDNYEKGLILNINQDIIQ